MTSPSVTAIPVQLVLAGAADAVTAAKLRQLMRQWLNELTWMSAEVCQDIVLGVNEALANCVEHAYRGRHAAGSMTLRASYDEAAQSIRVNVSDSGSWYRRPPKSPDDPRASRGILLMHALADHCTIDARPSGTTVYLEYTAGAGRDRWS